MAGAPPTQCDKETLDGSPRLYFLTRRHSQVGSSDFGVETDGWVLGGRPQLFSLSRVRVWFELYLQEVGRTLKPSVSQTFGNHGPLHRRSAHTWTTDSEPNIRKSPTPKYACK
jgi:hypothetical protein